MRRRLLVLTVCSLAALVHLSGCADSSTRAGRAWERAATTSRAKPQPGQHGYMNASDGLGGMVFVGDSNVLPRTAITGVPTE